jgi:hypothetical protein
VFAHCIAFELNPAIPPIPFLSSFGTDHFEHLSFQYRACVVRRTQPCSTEVIKPQREGHSRRRRRREMRSSVGILTAFSTQDCGAYGQLMELLTDCRQYTDAVPISICQIQVLPSF